MATFVALGRTTDDGMRQMDNLAFRHEHAKERVEEAGGKVVCSYALLGRYDYLVVLDFPDESAAMRFLSKEASRGHVRYETMSAISMKDFGDVVES